MLALVLALEVASPAGAPAPGATPTGVVPAKRQLNHGCACGPRRGPVPPMPSPIRASSPVRSLSLPRALSCPGSCLAPLGPRARSSWNREDWRAAYFTAEELAALPCRPRESFTQLQINENSKLILSNLGGQGGRCVTTTYKDGSTAQWSELCEERDPIDSGVGNNANNMHILIENVGAQTDYTTTPPTSRPVWMRITNESEYRAWRTVHNGIKRTGGAASNAGFFGVVNLLGPRLASQSNHWTPVRGTLGCWTPSRPECRCSPPVHPRRRLRRPRSPRFPPTSLSGRC